MNLPKKFVTTIETMWGLRGTQWLKELPQIIIIFVNKWELKNIKTYENLSVNYVAHAYSEAYNFHVVLKVSMPNSCFVYEQKALTHYNGHGCVKLLDYDLPHGVLLLESLVPGVTLKTLFPQQDKQAVKYTAQVIKKLHKDKNISDFEDYPTINSWLSALETPQSKIPQEHLDKARELAECLLNKDKRYVLHGDLHHENILYDSQRGWLAIDPKGVIGPLEYEIGPFIRNPYPELIDQPRAKDIINYRLTMFAQLLNLDRDVIAQWGYVQAVLAACWAYEDNLEFGAYFINCAQLIEENILY